MAKRKPEPAADPAAEAAPKAAKVETVLMERDPEVYPTGPRTAKVHPAEVENMKAGGWKVSK